MPSWLCGPGREVMAEERGALVAVCDDEDEAVVDVGDGEEGMSADARTRAWCTRLTQTLPQPRYGRIGGVASQCRRRHHPCDPLR